MAKRRKLEAPSASDLSKIEEEFRKEATSRPNPGMAPIAQVAAEAAEEFNPVSPEQRIAQAQDGIDASELREAKQQGLILLNLPITSIQGTALIRDRSVLDAGELAELEGSILRNGVRLPIEVFKLEEPEVDEEGREVLYGLLSGYRRLKAVERVFGVTTSGAPTMIKAILRNPKDAGDAFAAMVEENEIRSQLSQFERGRIAVLAVQKGAFVNLEAAVDAMFPVASKAKRSKIRSFALIFEELGDLLEFPELLKEKDGLRLASALKSGAGAKLRDALGTAQAAKTPDEELLSLTDLLDQLEPTKANIRKGGRPKINIPKAGWEGHDTLHLSNGITIRRETDSRGYFIRLEGKDINLYVVEDVMARLGRLLEQG